MIRLALGHTFYFSYEILERRKECRNKDLYCSERFQFLINQFEGLEPGRVLM